MDTAEGRGVGDREGCRGHAGEGRLGAPRDRAEFRAQAGPAGSALRCLEGSASTDSAQTRGELTNLLLRAEAVLGLAGALVKAVLLLPSLKYIL